MEPRALSLDDQLCFALYSATNAVVRSYRPRLEALGLTYPQYLVLLVLWQDGPSRMSHIARRLFLPGNAITPMVDRLEASGILRREPVPGDRRATQIMLTHKGEALHDEASRAQSDVVCDTGLDPAELSHLRDELKRMVLRMERPEGAGSQSDDPDHGRAEGRTAKE